MILIYDKIKMNNNTKNTKKKLSIMFSIIVFVIILWLWVSFLTIKYLTQYNFEKNNFIRISESIKSWKTNLNDIEKLWSRMEINILKNHRKFKIKPIENNLNIPFLNYIHLKDSKYLISSNIRDQIKSSLIEDIISSNKYLKIKYDDDFFIQKIELKNNESLIIFNKLHYTLTNYFKDIFLFLIISLLFSLLVYIIWRKFVDKTFIPVEKNMDDMRNFIQNAGHELKTPISVIDSNLQLLIDMKKFDSEMNNEMRAEVKKLNSLIDSLMNLSDNQNKYISKNNLLEITKEIEKDFKKQIKNKKIDINIKIAKNITIEANKDYLYIMISNLVWNAIKYNINGWKIDIIYKNNELIIKDTGIWINKNDLQNIFDRFYKWDKSRNTEWFGIWLSLVKKIADIYNWKIKVNSTEWKWTEIHVQMKMS